jgi:hypothetical protein
MTTNKEIQSYVKEKYGFNPKNASIAHAKEYYGIAVKRASNRKSTRRLWPCPKKHLVGFKEIFEHFGILEK